ncbi:hypothetical protein ACFX2G_034934 [Malus domestica]
MHVWHILLQYLPSDAEVECNCCIWIVHHFLVTRDPAPTIVEDGYSRAILGKQSGKVPGSRFLIESLSGGSDILLSLSLSLQRYSQRGRKLSISRCFIEGAFSEIRKS